MGVIPPLLKGGAHQDNGVHPLGEKQLNGFFPVLQLVSRAAQQGIISPFPKLLLQHRDGGGVINIGYVGAEDAHHLDGIEPQTAGEDVRRIAKLLNHLENVIPSLFADIPLSVEHPRYRRDGYPRLGCYIVDIQ